MKPIHVHRTLRMFSHWECERCGELASLHSELDLNVADASHFPLREDYEREHLEEMQLAVEEHEASCKTADA